MDNLGYLAVVMVIMLVLMTVIVAVVFFALGNCDLAIVTGCAPHDAIEGLWTSRVLQ